MEPGLAYMVRIHSVSGRIASISWKVAGRADPRRSVRRNVWRPRVFLALEGRRSGRLGLEHRKSGTRWRVLGSDSFSAHSTAGSKQGTQNRAYTAGLRI